MAYFQTKPHLGHVWNNILQELPERSYYSIQAHFMDKILPVLQAKDKGKLKLNLKPQENPQLSITHDGGLTTAFLFPVIIKKGLSTQVLYNSFFSGVHAEDMERWQTHVLEILQDQFARNELKYYEDIKSEELAKRVGQGCTPTQITEYLSSK